jgi:hypothetical protein
MLAMKPKVRAVDDLTTGSMPEKIQQTNRNTEINISHAGASGQHGDLQA